MWHNNLLGLLAVAPGQLGVTDHEGACSGADAGAARLLDRNAILHRPRMFDWNDLRHFMAVARHGSTIAAAKSLKVSQSTVHRRLEELEARMGRHLVVRHATGYKLTEFGTALLPVATQVEAAVIAVERFVSAADVTMTGPVRVTCSESIGYRLMQSALLDEFQKRHPGMRVDLIMCDRFLDLSKREAGVARRAGEQSDDKWMGSKIAAVPWALYASETYIRRYGTIEGAHQLDDHIVVEFDGALSSHAASKWLKAMAPKARATARSNSIPGLLMTVKSGAGIAPLPVPLASKEADLVSLISPIPGLESNIYLLTHPDMRQVPRVKAFFEFMTAEVDTVRRVLTGEKCPRVTTDVTQSHDCIGS